ncbi:MAG: PIN domain-containing protein [Candidatus Woesearchaeota archaeon]
MKWTKNFTMTESYYVDTYALIELILGNPNYKQYAGCEAVLTQVNIFELFFYVLRTQNETAAYAVTGGYEHLVRNMLTSDVLRAAKLKFVHKKKKLSMADCIGYETARRLGIKFLTGDKAFKDMKNVEFVA